MLRRPEQRESIAPEYWDIPPRESEMAGWELSRIAWGAGRMAFSNGRCHSTVRTICFETLPASSVPR